MSKSHDKTYYYYINVYDGQKCNECGKPAAFMVTNKMFEVPYCKNHIPHISIATEGWIKKTVNVY